MPTIQFECRALHRETIKVPCGVRFITCRKCPSGKGVGTRMFPMKTNDRKSNDAPV